MARTKLSEEEIAGRLARLSGWALADGKLRRRFQFPNFVTAFSWMTGVALVAERLDHHPDWKNVYGTVDVELWTHDAGGLTTRDFELASEMSRQAEPLLRS